MKLVVRDRRRVVERSALVQRRPQAIRHRVRQCPERRLARAKRDRRSSPGLPALHGVALGLAARCDERLAARSLRTQFLGQLEHRRRQIPKPFIRDCRSLNREQTSTGDTVQEALDDVGVDALEPVVMERRERGVDIDARLQEVVRLPLRIVDLAKAFARDRPDGVQGRIRVTGLIRALQELLEALDARLRQCGLADEAEAVEHLPAELVRGLDEVVEKTRVRLTFTRVCRDQVVEPHLLGLTDAVDATHALLEPNQRPRDVPVDEHLSGLQVDALVAGIS